MKRILSLLVILISLCLPVTSFAICGPAPDPGADWVFPGSFCEDVLLVCPTSEYTTITEAMAAAGAWDTILVVQGTYNEAVTFSQNNLTLKAFGSPENTIITQAAGTTVSFSTKYGCTLEGFTVSLSAATSTNDEVIWSNNNSATAYNTVKNCIIDVENAGGSTFGLYGINIDDGNFRLLNNRIAVTQTNNSALYAMWNTAVHTSEYRDNIFTIDQQSTGTHMTTGIHHGAGAGSIMHCTGNVLNLTSTHTVGGLGAGVYADARDNYVNDNIISAVTTGTGIMYGVYTGGSDTNYLIGNAIHAATNDGDGTWCNSVGTTYAHGNTVTGDGVLVVGGTMHGGSNAVNDVIIRSGVQLLSVTNVSFAANADTVLYTVPAGYSLILDHAKIVAGADAASTDITIGQNTAESDFLPTNQMDNLDAADDAIIVMPVPNTTPTKCKEYAAGIVIEMNVANQAGGATNAVYLYGTLY